MFARRSPWPLALPRVLLVAPAARAADPKVDDHTVWKHDKGSFEKTGDGKWVEKRGDDTFEMIEKKADGVVVELRDPKRKLSVWLTDKSADVRKDGQPKAEKLTGGWVAAEKPSDPDPKTDPKADEAPTPKAEHTVWKHDGGWFAKTGDGKWTERRGKDTFELTEGKGLPGTVRLEDGTRKLHVILKEDSAFIQKEGQKIKDGETLKGGWVAVGAKADLDPAKDGRTLWKSPDATFELSAPGVWTETTGKDFKTVKKYTQKAVTEEYVELLDEESKLKWVRLTDKAMLTRLTELNKYAAEGRPGGWVKSDKPVPTGGGKYAEVARLAPEQVEGVVAVSPDGKLVARKLGKPLAAEYGVVEAATGKVVQKWKEEGGGTMAAAWSADGKTFATYVSGGDRQRRPAVAGDRA